MGTSDGTVKIRVDPAELDRWKAYAVEHAVSLSTLIRDSVERRMAPPATRPSLGVGDTIVPPAPSATSGPISGSVPGRIVSAMRESADLGRQQSRAPLVSSAAARAVERGRRQVRCSARTPAGSYCKTCGAIHQ